MSLPVKELRKSVNIWGSYGQEFGVLFFWDTVYNNFFLSKLGRKLADQSGDYKEISFLFQRLSVLIQRYNAILLHDCFVKGEEE